MCTLAPRIATLAVMHPTTQPINFAHIALSVPLYGGFDYRIPDTSISGDLLIGSRVLVPFGHRKLVGIVLDLKASTEVDADKIKLIESVLDTYPVFTKGMLELLQWAARYYGHPIGEVLHNALPAALRKSNPTPNYTQSLWRSTGKAFEGRSNAAKQRALLSAIDANSAGLWEDALKVMGYTKASLKKLETDGYIYSVDSTQTSQAMKVSEPKEHYLLNDEQARASKSIERKLGAFAPHLLEGITGSGKTEVYIAAVQACLKTGKQALILIPEINLTPQTFKRFQSQLGAPVAVYHSGMSEKEKFITYQNFQSGQAQVVIGTRSAIFIPNQSLGLIVVDEEHDASYKQSDGFKYSARDLSVKRAQLENCNVVLGSATPSSDSYHNAQEGRFNWLTLTKRANEAALPKVSLEDMRALPSKDIFSPRILAAIKEQLDAHNQVIIFQNRRGLAPSLMCFECGWLCQCPNCDTRITVHQKPARLHCHHCDYKQAIPLECGHCKGQNLHPLGAGTQRLEHILAYNFPNIPTIRIDRDEIKSQADLEKATKVVHEGQPCLIVGTQMIAKGHDFPNVTLVVVTDADGLLFSTDFRALEKGAQQLLQVAGRAGRAKKSGNVLIQTHQPEHPLFEHLKQHNYAKFIESELRDRELCALPPFSKLMSMRAESEQQLKPQQALEAIKEQLRGSSGLETLCIAGPIAAGIKRKKNRFRYYLHVFCEDARQRHQAQQCALHFMDSIKDSKLRISIDIDPIETN